MNSKCKYRNREERPYIELTMADLYRGESMNDSLYESMNDSLYESMRVMNGLLDSEP